MALLTLPPSLPITGSVSALSIVIHLYTDANCAYLQFFTYIFWLQQMGQHSCGANQCIRMLVPLESINDRGYLVDKYPSFLGRISSSCLK